MQSVCSGEHLSVFSREDNIAVSSWDFFSPSVSACLFKSQISIKQNILIHDIHFPVTFTKPSRSH